MPPTGLAKKSKFRCNFRSFWVRHMFIWSMIFSWWKYIDFFLQNIFYHFFWWIRVKILKNHRNMEIQDLLRSVFFPKIWVDFRSDGQDFRKNPKISKMISWPRSIHRTNNWGHRGSYWRVRALDFFFFPCKIRISRMSEPLSRQIRISDSGNLPCPKISPNLKSKFLEISDYGNADFFDTSFS